MTHLHLELVMATIRFQANLSLAMGYAFFVVVRATQSDHGLAKALSLATRQ